MLRQSLRCDCLAKAVADSPLRQAMALWKDYEVEGGRQGRSRSAACRGRGACRQLDYRGTSLIRNNPSLGPYSKLMHRALWWS